MEGAGADWERKPLVRTAGDGQTAGRTPAMPSRARAIKAQLGG